MEKNVTFILMLNGKILKLLNMELENNLKDNIILNLMELKAVLKDLQQYNSLKTLFD